MRLRLASLCDGIGSAHVAASAVGWTSVAASEIDPRCVAVVLHHFPDVVHMGDMLSPGLKERLKDAAPDVLMASTPCQAFSTIGRRSSLEDARGNLTLALVNICEDIRPPWLVWENVPGVLNTRDNAFGHLISGIAGLSTPVQPDGPAWPTAGICEGPLARVAWRVIDSQGFVPQRRRRVFVVAGRDGRDPARVIFEQATLSPEPARTAEWADAPRKLDDPLLAFDWQAAGAGNDRSFRGGARRWIVRPPGLVGTLNTSRVDAVLDGKTVRKLTPAEAGRLMGFPEGYLEAVRVEGRPISDGDRHRMAGNSIVTHILAWLFRRIGAAEQAAARTA
jgi:DNA (cytosine-5)-methyltransferase 1